MDLSLISRSNNIGYGPRELPCARDGEIRAVLQHLCAGTQSNPSLLKPEHSDVLRAYAERMASLAVRENSADLVVSGLEALSLARKVSGDRREDTAVLALLWDATLKVNVDVPAVARVALRRGCGEAFAALALFGERDAPDKTLQSMGYEEGRDETGFRYLRTW